ncbi:MAG: diguanylate cyclase [Gammaproteobacteria bacterium]
MYTEQIDNKKTDIIFKHAKVALFATLLGAGIITYVLLDTADLRILLPWLLTVLVFNIARHYLLYIYNRDPAAVRNKRYWLRYFNIGALITGSLWGFIGVYTILTQPLHSIAVMVLLSGYLVMGASINYSIFISTFLAFSLPVVVPVLSGLLINNSVTAQSFGILLGIFFIYSIISAFRYHSTVTSFITYELNNSSLLDNLRHKQAEASQLNRKLEEDLVKLRKVEEQLRLEKGKAEELAAQLQTISSCDGLTGIANRRSFDEMLAREWNRAIRAQTPLSLIICDIDHFKPYNDYFGHQKGDMCLIRIAQILDERARRAGDVAARYGGEEFTIILPETSLENASGIAEEIRKAIEDSAIPHPVSETGKVVTMSFGVATIIPRRDQDTHKLITLADNALYEAKHNGRNRVVASKPGVLVEQGVELNG